MKRLGTLITLVLIMLVVTMGVFIMNGTKKNEIMPAVPSPTPTQSTQASTGSSDKDLDIDFQSVDTKVKALNADSVIIDQSINDQQGDLSEQ